jgi:hypothetical protein
MDYISTITGLIKKVNSNDPVEIQKELETIYFTSISIETIEQIQKNIVLETKGETVINFKKCENEK